MIVALLAAEALAGPQGALGDTRWEVDAALGARWMVLVGDDADLTRYDPVANEGVAVSPLALEGELIHTSGLFSALRLEEGVVHAGAVEAAEAKVGWRAPQGWGELWGGRGDLPVTRDRRIEVEDNRFSVAPLLSRAALPSHAAGVGGGIAWPERAELNGGLAWTSTGADAPVTWGRLDLHPLGAVPEAELADRDRPAFNLGIGASRLDSQALGRSALLTADGELRLGSWQVAGGWTRWTSDDGVTRARDGATAQVGGRALRLGAWGVYLAARVERVTGLEEGEDARWLGAARGSLAERDQRWEAYVEWLPSRELGTGVIDGEDVVVLGRGVERANDALSVGARARF